MPSAAWVAVALATAAVVGAGGADPTTTAPHRPNTAGCCRAGQPCFPVAAVFAAMAEDLRCTVAYPGDPGFTARSSIHDRLYQQQPFVAIEPRSIADLQRILQVRCCQRWSGVGVLSFQFHSLGDMQCSSMGDMPPLFQPRVGTNERVCCWHWCWYQQGPQDPLRGRWGRRGRRGRRGPCPSLYLWLSL